MYQALQKAPMKNSKQARVFLSLVTWMDVSHYILSKEGNQGVKWILTEAGILEKF